MARHYKTMQEFAIVVVGEVENEDRDSEIARVRKLTQIQLAYRGHQRGFWLEGYWTPFDLTYLQGDTRGQAMMLSDNIFRPQVRSLLKEWTRSRPRLQVIARFNSRAARAAARFASARLEAHQARIQTESFRQQEGKNCFLQGNFFRYSFLGVDKDSPKLRVPITEEVQAGEGMVRLKGYRLQPLLRPQTILADSRGVKIPLSARSLPEATYLRWLNSKDTVELRMQYGDDIPVGISSEILQHILSTERDVGTSDWSYWSYSATDYANRSEITHLWLKPPRYYDVVVEGIGNLAEAFPDGLLLILVRDKLVDYRAEDLVRVWTHGTFDELAERPYGDGVDDALSDQFRYNELRAMRMEAILYGGFSKRVINEKLIDPSLLENNATVVPMSRHADIVTRAQDAYGIIPPVETSREVSEEMLIAERNMRTKTGATPLLTGESDQELRTATGMAVTRESALAILGLPLALRSEVDVEWAYQILELEQASFIPEYHLRAVGDYSRFEAEAFYRADIRNDLEITVAANSWIPRTESELRADFVAFVQGGFLNPAIPLEIRRKALEVFKVPIQLDKVQPYVRIAEMRLDLLLQAAKVLPHEEDYQLPPEAVNLQEEIKQYEDQLVLALVSRIPFNLYSDDHATIMDVYREALTTDDFLYAPPIARQAVEALIQRHRDALRRLTQEIAVESGEDTALQQGAMAQGLQQIVGKQPDGQPDGQPAQNPPTQIPASVANRLQDQATPVAAAEVPAPTS